MREVEVFNWWIPPEPWEKKPHASRWKMTLEEAARYGATEPVENTREVRQVDLTPDEVDAQRTSAWQKNGVKGS